MNKLIVSEEIGKDDWITIIQDHIDTLETALETLEAVKNQLSHLYHNGQIIANTPERDRIQKQIVHAEYVIEKAKGNNHE